MRSPAAQKRWLWVLPAVLASAGGFLWMSQSVHTLGFPLDDAWIHQTIARNLVSRGEWAFLPGRPGSASTSPAWTGLMALGRGAGLDPLVWAYAVGCALLAALSWNVMRWAEERGTRSHVRVILLGGLVLAEWHLVWAAVSGMEILLLALSVVLVLREAELEPMRPVRIGAMIGASMWIRPEAVLLLAAVAWRIGSVRQARTRTASSLALVALGAGVPAVLYLGFHAALTGELWPTTFFAKVAEYAIETQAPLAGRWSEQILPPLIASGFVLLPGVLLSIVRSVRDRSWGKLTPLVWVFLHTLAYAVRLPVNYQHGRYAMPVIPVLLVLGMEGLASMDSLAGGGAARRILNRAWSGAVLAVTAVFWWVGGRAYSQDVAIIDTEMVAAARWIAAHTEPDARVAAHDIGALGYFGDREVLDLAGLAEPEVIPFLRDEARLELFLDDQGADYLMTFPGLYPGLVVHAQALFTTHGAFSRVAGGENMTVYRWGRDVVRGDARMLYSSAGEPERRADGNDRHFDRR